MHNALALRTSSMKSVVAIFVALLTLTAGGAGGYWLRSQVAAPDTAVAAPLVPPAGQGQVAPFHDMPEYSANVGADFSSRTGD